MKTRLTMGPILFHWPAEKKRDFYFRIADETIVDTVYLGEVICSKRSPFFDQYYAEVAERLIDAGKQVVFSSLAEIMIPRERKMTQGLCEMAEFEIEANDTTALYYLRHRPHRVGQYFNVYNEDTMTFLTSKGATHFTLPSELPKEAIEVLAAHAKTINVALEVQVYGRTGLALSARCYHARAHGRIKDNCQFVCEENSDGMELETLENKPFLTVNGIQTLSHTYLNLIQEIPDMQEMGITDFRLSPHSYDMVEISRIFKDVIDKKSEPKQAKSLLEGVMTDIRFSNGFYHRKKGASWHNNT